MRYSDGVQICWGLILVSAYSSSKHVISFPKAFKNTSYGFSNTPIYTGQYDTVYEVEYTSSQGSVSSRTTSSVTILRTLSRSWIAIGRWK